MAKWPYSDPAWPKVRRYVLDRDGWTCQLCGGSANAVDHIVSLVDGGHPFDPLNLRAICRPCNSRRGAATRERRRVSWLIEPSREW